jgi:hypothetical protein
VNILNFNKYKNMSLCIINYTALTQSRGYSRSWNLCCSLPPQGGSTTDIVVTVKIIELTEELADTFFRYNAFRFMSQITTRNADVIITMTKKRDTNSLFHERDAFLRSQ